MERRRSKRKVLRLKAERISGNQRHAVFIENLSENGIHIITPSKTAIDIDPGTPLELKFQFLSGKIMNLHCNVKWSHKIPPNGLTRSVGIEIIDPPPKYKEFLKTLI